MQDSPYEHIESLRRDEEMAAREKEAQEFQERRAKTVAEMDDDMGEDITVFDKEGNEVI